MLSPEKARALLMHEDPDIREMALSYFFSYKEREPGLVADLLALIEEYPDCETAKQAALRCSGALASWEEVAAVLDFLEGERPELINSLLQKAVVLAPPGVLAARLDDLGENPRLSKENRAAIAERAAFYGRPAAELWAELEEAIDLSAGTDFSDMDVEDLNLEELDLGDPGGQSERIDALIDALEDAELPAEVRYADRIGPKYHFWKRRSYIRLAGARRERALAPRLIADLGSEEGEDDEPRVEALANLADPELVPLLEETYRAKGLYARCSLCQVLGTWKLPQSEAVLLRALKEEEDASQRTLLCLALTDLLSEAAFEPILEVARGDYDRSIVRLSKRLRALAAIFGKPMPELEEDDETPAIFDRRSPLMLDIDPMTAAEEMMPQEIETFRRAEKKVGRNEPCPCGSKKKYKKCCGR